MSLSSLIVQREVASIRQVEEALARQVLYGGDLVTNLLEVVQLPESVLVPLLAESMGMLAAPIGLLPPPTAQARALVPEDVAARRGVMPLSVEKDKLVLAVSEPLGRDVLDELGFALGVTIEERIAPSVRIHEALARVYGVPLERRMGRLVGRLAGVDPTVPNSLPPLRAAKASSPPLPGALSHDIPKLNPPGMPAMGSMRFPETRLPGEDRKPVPSGAPPPPAPPPPQAAATKQEPAPTPLPTGARAALPRLLRDAKPGAVDAPRRRGPITLDRVTDELPEIKDREALLSLFFDFSRQFFEYSAIFVVHGDVAEGRDAFGSGAPRERVLAVGVPLDIPGILRNVRERGVPMCAFPEAGGLDGVLMSDLRRSARFQVLVVPVVVRSRVVAFFIADDGAAGIDPASQGEVTTVAALVGREFERLIVRMKLQGFAGEAPAPERRVDPRRVETKRRRNDPEVRGAAAQALGQALAAPPPSTEAPPPVVADEPPPPHSLAPATLASFPAPPPQARSERPGAFRPESIAAPVVTIEVPPTAVQAPSEAPPPDSTRPDASISPLPRSYKTLRNFLVPLADDALPGDAAVGDPAPGERGESGEPLPVRPVESFERAPSFDDLTPVRSHDSFEPPPSFEDLIGLEGVRSRRGAFSDRPPPPQALVVRHPSGNPIPREELDADGSPVSSTKFVSERQSSRPPPADLRQARLLREIDALAASFVHSEPQGPVSQRGGQSVTIPPHLPPMSRSHLPLPSVIVDVAAQTDQLVEAFIANPKDERAEAELLRLGNEAMPSIMKQFPGPLTITRETLDDSWPRVTECGPVLRLIAGQRRVALPFVLKRTEDGDTEARFWATYLLTELAYADAIPAVVARLFDDSKRVRRAARLVAHVLGDTTGAALVAELDRIVRDAKASSARRVVTLDTLGEMRDPIVVPVLLNALGDADEDVGIAARRALMLVSRQDFGRDARKWIAWWNAASSRHRLEWLIDALTHEVPAIRRAAGQELKAVTEEYFGYYDDLPKKDRERAQQRYREWWKNEGHARFRKA
jgi:HEAT repeat protein